MTSKLQANSPITLYYQLELLLRERIESGELKPGESLPSENSLAEMFNVSRITVRRAFDRLEEDGLIIRRRGARTILSPKISLMPKGERPRGDFRGFEDELHDLGIRPNAAILEVSEGAPPSFIASLLDLPPGAEAVRIRRLGRAGEQPLWIESRYFPLDVGRELVKADLGKGSILTLINQVGYQVAEVEMHLQAVIATPRQSQLLAISSNDALLLHQSVSRTEDRRVIQVARVYLRGDLYKLVLNAKPQKNSPGLALTSGGYLVGGSSLIVEGLNAEKSAD
ncbi:GntR family transcriptional regulator [Lacisediminimonas profundi]|uniref:GntR family transcriptional regulator n=1 Tax=Lacisediminimonas profundi TaxID=2603856 RepID=UPI00124B9E1A|nr:GntR family transcriptional regulator [Lacisediminimonas profundi]